MKRKMLGLLLAAVMGISLVGCGSSGKEEVEDTVQEQEVEEETESNTDNASYESSNDEYWLKDPSEVTGTIVVYTTMDDGQQQVVEDVWYNHYPDCTIEWLSDSLGTLMTKVQTEASNPYADVILGGLFQSDDDSYYENLEPYTAVNANEQTVIDPNGYYTYLDMQYMCLVVNTDLEEELGVEINSYADLLDPKLKGYVILADPASTSSGFRQFTTILQLCSGGTYADDTAWDYIKQLMGNSVSTTSSSTVYKSVMEGEYAVGLSYESIVQYQIESGADNIRLVYPEEGNTACASGGAMVKNCPNRTAAEAMLDLLGCEEMQEARAQSNCARGTNVNFTYEGYPSDSEIGVQDLDFTYISEHKEELLDKWATLWEDYGAK